MTEVILKLILAGATIFTDERRRKFEGDLYDLLNVLQNAKNARYPMYSDAAVAKAQQDLDNYLIAYTKELEQNITQAKAVAA